MDGLKKCWRSPELKAHAVQERRKLPHAFMAVNPMWAGCVAGWERVFLDDIFTYGATLSEAARACLEAGAKTVSLIALASAAKLV